MTTPPAEAAAEIFISYARNDADFAERLRKGIEGGGFSVWMDTISIAGGDRWTKETESAIEGATSVVVVVTAASNESVWVRREVLYAQQLGKRVVPVLAEQVHLPVHLINLNTLVLHENFEAGVDRLLNTLQGQPAGATAAAGKTTPPVPMGKALWLFVGAAVVVVLAVIAVRGEGLVAEVLATGLAIGGVLLGMSWKADDAISIELKRDLSLWLVQIDPAALGNAARLAETYAELFDGFFGNEYVSLRRIRRSWFISTLSVVATTMLWWVYRPEQFEALLDHSANDITGLFGSVIFSAYILNLVPDYLSAMQTRWFITLVRKTKSNAVVFALILADALITSAIFAAFFLFFVATFDWLYGLSKEIRAVWDVLQFQDYGGALRWLFEFGPTLQVHSSGNVTIGVFFYSTFFASLWLWVLAIVVLILRVVRRMSGIGRFLVYALPIEQRPLRSIGQVMAFIATLSYVLAALPASIFGG